RRQVVARQADGVAVVGDEALHVGDDIIHVTYRAADLVGVVGQQGGHRGEVLVELLEQITAIPQGRHQCRQVADCGEDVATVVPERRKCLGQFDSRISDLCALAPHVVGGG